MLNWLIILHFIPEVYEISSTDALKFGLDFKN